MGPALSTIPIFAFGAGGAVREALIELRWALVEVTRTMWCGRKFWQKRNKTSHFKPKP